jgi:hypothetical protein
MVNSWLPCRLQENQLPNLRHHPDTLSNYAAKSTDTKAAIGAELMVTSKRNKNVLRTAKLVGLTENVMMDICDKFPASVPAAASSPVQSVVAIPTAGIDNVVTLQLGHQTDYLKWL